MSIIFDKLERFSRKLNGILHLAGEEIFEGHNFGWPNYVYTSPNFRRAHLDIIDARETKKLYMMHLCIFPHFDDSSPIFGLDLISGPTKVTGAFHDFSPTIEGHHLSKKFENKVKEYGWNKERELPDWAKMIFSPNMVAVGNIKEVEELDKFIELTMHTLHEYLAFVGSTEKIINTKTQQNFYCQQQKKNPHTPKVMESLGIEPEVVQNFIQNCLFPEIA